MREWTRGGRFWGRLRRGVRFRVRVRAATTWGWQTGSRAVRIRSQLQILAGVEKFYSVQFVVFRKRYLLV